MNVASGYMADKTLTPNLTPPIPHFFMTTSAQANEKLKRILRAGKLFEGKYRILRPLGAGSFAVVVHARHEVMERDVALKFLKPKVVESNPEVSDRFVKEVQIASRLKHPNIVQIYDFGETEDGIYYMVQEFVDGVTLDAVLDQAPNKRLPHDQVMSIMHQVAACLAEAHRHNVIHRDLKPSNLMSMQREGKEIIKILDFGVAKLLEPNERGSASRQSTKFIGTPIYMSPEQILGLEVGPASDLYSLGLMFYEMLTGQPPIQAELVAEVVQQHLSEEAFSFPLLKTLDPLAQKIILKATKRYPEDRFKSAQEVAQALSGEFDFSSPAPAAEPSRSSGPSEFFGLTIDEPEAETEDELDVFLGKNYIAMSEEDYAPSEFSPIRSAPSPLVSTADSPPPMAARPQAAPAPAPSPAPSPPPKPQPAPRLEPSPTTSGLTQLPANLELDMDAMRDAKRGRGPVRRPRPEQGVESSALMNKPKLPKERSYTQSLPLYFGALAALFCAYIMLSALTDGMPAGARVLLGFFPLIGALLWTGFGYSTLNRDVSSRWLIPLSHRSLIACALVLVSCLLIFPGRAHIAFVHEGAWGVSFLPDAVPFGSLKALIGSVMKSLGELCGKLAQALPWAR